MEKIQLKKSPKLDDITIMDYPVEGLDLRSYIWAQDSENSDFIYNL